MKSPVAERYAKALFLLADEKNELGSTAGQLKAIKELFKDKTIEQFFFTTQITMEEKLRLIQAAFRDQLGSILRNALMVIFRNNRQMALPDIIDEFMKLYNARKNVAEVTITVSEGLYETLEKSIKERLARILQKDIVLKTEIDPTLIGGLKLRVGNVIFDASLKNRLQQLQKKLLAS